MRIMYFVPHLNTVSAGRTIMYGYKNAFEDMGHSFRFLTANDILKESLAKFAPNILFISLNPYHVKFLDIKVLRRAKNSGTKVFVQIPMWRSPISRSRLNEFRGLCEQSFLVDLIVKEDIGDLYYSSLEKDDLRMDGFIKATGCDFITIPLAADKTLCNPSEETKFKADISYVGTNLPEKREFLSNVIFPLREKYKVKIYGQDWNQLDILLGYMQKIGQYLNIPKLRDITRENLSLDAERSIYFNTVISFNIHEKYQKKFGGDCNERTFKIPLSGGFEICDAVPCLHRYFKIGTELLLAYNTSDWIELIEFFLKNPEKRKPYIEAGKRRVLKDHTYHSRVEKLLNYYTDI